MWGSGVLLQIADIGFVLTAGHVLEKTKDQEMLLGPMVEGSETITAQDGQFGYSPDLDDLDVGFIRLSREVAQKLSKYKSFTRLSELDFRTSHPTPGAYCILGYPKRFNTPDYEARAIDPVPLYYLSRPVILPDEGKPDVTLCLEVARDTVMLCDLNAATEEEIRMPELGGISGCGIWRLYGTENRIDQLDRWEPSWIRLVGIEHTWVRRKRVRGTFIRHTIDLIGGSWPELRASIQLSR
jgi:hypothetical protein